MADGKRSATGGTQLLALAGCWLVASGVATWLFAGSGKLLPHDAALLGITGPELCQLDSCRILAFLAQDRVAFAGTLLATGFLYLWLAREPLARGEAWAFWTLLLSGLAGLFGCVSFLQFDRLDLPHLWAMPVELGLFAPGLALAWSGLPSKLGPRAALREALAAGDEIGAGRTLLAFVGGGIVAAGITIWAVGATRAFVPTDFDFLKVRLFELRALNPRLVPLVAHDRCGFGGALCASGLTVLAIALCGLRRADAALWGTLSTAGLAGFGAAIGIHFAVGYTNLTHLAPAFVGAAAFAAALLLLYRPLHLG